MACWCTVHGPIFKHISSLILGKVNSLNDMKLHDKEVCDVKINSCQCCCSFQSNRNSFIYSFIHSFIHLSQCVEYEWLSFQIFESSFSTGNQVS